MDETTEKREERIGLIKEDMTLERRLNRARSEELNGQPEHVQRLTNEQDLLTQRADGLEQLGEDDGEFPATAAARQVLVDSMRRYAAALGVEIRTHWQQKESS